MQVATTDERLAGDSARASLRYRASRRISSRRSRGSSALRRSRRPTPRWRRRFRRLPEERAAERVLLEALAARGYQEAITLAFVDPALQTRLFPEQPGLALANPIASDLAVMRVSLWPGLLRAALENQRRQQDRVRLFEHGTRFITQGAQTREIDSLAGIACGARLPEQWGVGKEARGPADFYDVKNDVTGLLAATGEGAAFSFEAAAHPALHPGRSARVLRRGEPVGWLGELHPALAQVDGFYICAGPVRVGSGGPCGAAGALPGDLALSAGAARPGRGAR